MRDPGSDRSDAQALDDDENNNDGCNFDGGDCCGPNVNTTYCKVCQCLEGSGGGPGGMKNFTHNCT